MKCWSIAVLMASMAVLAMASSPSPLDVLKTLDCNARRLAIKFAARIQPWRTSNEDLHDALRLSALCGDDAPPAASSRQHDTTLMLAPKKLCVGDCYYVKASQTFGGSAVSPFPGEEVEVGRVFASVEAALGAARRQNTLEPGKVGKTIVLEDGVHFLNATQVLAASDSGTMITGAVDSDGKPKAWLSGGAPLPKNIVWKPWSNPAHAASRKRGIWVADLTTSAAGRAIIKNLPTPPSLNTMAPMAKGVPARLINARFPNADPETAQWGYASPLNKNWSIDAAVVDHWVKPPPNGAIPTYTFVDLSEAGNPSGFVKNNSAMRPYNTYTHGRGGVCDSVWDPDEPSYWCSNASAGGWAEVDFHAAQAGQLNLPVGMVINVSQGSRAAHFKNWKGDVSDAVVHAWHSQSWFTNSFTVESADLATGTLKFSGGGQQGGRNWCRCDQCAYAGPWCGQKQTPPIKNDTRLISGSWYVEGILDELDAPGEFFFDRKGGKLYVYANETDTTTADDADGATATVADDAVPASLATLVVPLLPVLISIQAASPGAPVRDIAIKNVGFRDASKTIMHKWAAPSGGDWAMHRGGALFIENAENVTVSGSRFTRVDGNAVFLSRHTRDVTVERCAFEWLGMGGVTTWGETQGYDVSKRTVPLRTTVKGNFFRELGIWEKQSSAVGLAKSALTRIEGNIMFNMPRAAINFNDGMGGANDAIGNLIFNTCRESGDHGAMNSWDRMPFLHDLTPTGGHAPTFTFDTLPNHITSNFVIANYGSSEGIDNDDGSSSYHIDSNVFYWADGFKMDYGGHDSTFTNNVVLSIPYDGQNCVNLASFVKGHGHSASNNTCAVGIGGHHTGSGCGDPSCINVTRTQLMDHVVHLAQCDGTVRIHGNRYFSPSGNTTVSCGGKEMVLEEAQAQYPIEADSTGGRLPTAEVMTGWIKDRLHL